MKLQWNFTKLFFTKLPTFNRKTTVYSITLPLLMRFVLCDDEGIHRSTINIFHMNKKDI